MFHYKRQDGLTMKDFERKPYTRYEDCKVLALIDIVL